MKSSQQPKIAYSQSWEDAELLLKALQPRTPDRILSITSGGCNTLALLSSGVKEVTALDINPAQNYLLELKLAAIMCLSYNDCLAFLGVIPSRSRIELFERIAVDLSPECRAYWLTNKVSLSHGVIHCGRFEKYLQLFRKRILSLVHSAKTIDTLLLSKSTTEQISWYERHWNTFRWRLVFKVFFSKSLMKLLGRSPAMFRFSGKQKISTHYLAMVREAFTRQSVFNNPYVQYILKGNYVPDLPEYLKQNSYRHIAENGASLRIIPAHILEHLKTMPDGYFSGFNLSDVFEPLSERDTELVFSEILRTGTNGARLIFWNNLVRRDVPQLLSESFRKENALIAELKQEEKVFFYSDLMIYTLVK